MSAARPEGTPGPDGGGQARARQGWLSDHSGRLSGTVLGLAMGGFLSFLAVIGFKPALFLLAFVVAGLVMIVVGGRIRGS